MHIPHPFILANLEAASSTVVVIVITLIVLCVASVAVGLLIFFRKQAAERQRIEEERKKRDEAIRAEQEAQERKRLEEEAARLQALQIQSVQAANEYKFDAFTCSQDLPKEVQPLTKPSRQVPGEEQTPPRVYNLTIHDKENHKNQTFKLTKPVISVGRAGTSRAGQADICIPTSSSAISRVHAVLSYKYFPDEDGCPSFWLLAINQFSNKNPGPENVRKATMVTENGQQVVDVAFVIDGKQKIFLSDSLYLTID